MSPTRIVLILVLLAATVAGVRFVAMRGERSRLPADPAPQFVQVSRDDFTEIFRTGPARRMPRAPPPRDVVAEGPRKLSDLIPPLTPREVTIFFGASGSQDMVQQPFGYYSRAAKLDKVLHATEYPGGQFAVRTNSLGMRRDGEVLEQHPALRVLVTGDSHVDGVVPNEENFCALLERRLLEQGVAPTVEVLNAGVGGSTIPNYLGVLERFKGLKPDVVMATVYGGNDFFAQCVFERYLRGLEPHVRSPAIDPVLKAGAETGGVLAQDLLQALYFLANPQDEPLAVAGALEDLLAMRQQSEALGARFLVAYLPPGSAVQYPLFAEKYGKALGLAGVERAALEVSQRIADRVIEGLAQAGVTVVDLRPALAANAQPCYWFADMHLSTRGNAVVAQALEPVLAELARAPK